MSEKGINYRGSISRRNELRSKTCSTKTNYVSSINASTKAISKKLLNHKGTQVVGQACSTGGAIKGAGEEFPRHFIC